MEAWSVLFVFALVWLEVGWDLFIFVEAVTDLFSVVVVVVVVVTMVVVWATAVLVA